MEKITGFLKELQERLASPFFSSYLISWLIFNWRIVIGLFWYNAKELSDYQHQTFFDLIKGSDNAHLFWQPLAGAFGYTVFYPFFRNLIIALHAWTGKWGNRWALNISCKGQVSLEKYMQLRRALDKRGKMLEETLSKDSEYQEENTKLTNARFELQNELNSVKKDLSRWTDISNINFWNGTWDIKYRLRNDVLSAKIYLYGGEATYSNHLGRSEPFLKIKSFACNLNTGEYMFRFDLYLQNQVLTVSQVFRLHNTELFLLKSDSEGDTIIEWERATVASSRAA